MFCILWSFFLWICGSCSFSQPSEIAVVAVENPDLLMNVINNHVNNIDWILDYAFAENVSMFQKLDSIPPVLIYDMGRYIDDAFISSNPYFSSRYVDQEYKNYLRAYVLQYGSNLNLKNEYEAHISVLLSTLQKMYVFNYSNFQLDSIDYYILDWAKVNIPNEIAEWRNMVLNSPYKVKSISFLPEIIVK